MPEINSVRLADALRERGWKPEAYGPKPQCVSITVATQLDTCHVMWDLGQHFQAEDFREEIRPSLEELWTALGWVMYWPLMPWDVEQVP